MRPRRLTHLGALAQVAWVACVSLPAQQSADIVVSAADASVCAANLSNPALSPDGNAVAWLGDQNIWIRDLTTGATTNAFVPTQEYVTGPVAISPDGRYAAATAVLNGNSLAYVHDRNAVQTTALAAPQGCTFYQLAWSRDDHSLALMCENFSVQVYNPADLTQPLLQVAAPAAVVTCGHLLLPEALYLDATAQRAATICNDDQLNVHVVAWSYASGVAATTVDHPVTFAESAGPLLPYPYNEAPLAIGMHPTDGNALATSGFDGVFTVDTAKNFAITRMLSDTSAAMLQYDANGAAVVALMYHGYGARLQAWQLGDGANPYFVSTGDLRQYNFAISDNGVIGACDNQGAFLVWHLHRPHG